MICIVILHGIYVELTVVRIQKHGSMMVLYVPFLN